MRHSHRHSKRRRHTRTTHRRRKGGMMRTMTSKKFNSKFLTGNRHDLSRNQLSAMDRAETSRLNALESQRLSQQLPFSPSPEYPTMPASLLESALADESHIHINKSSIESHLSTWTPFQRIILFKWMHDVCYKYAYTYNKDYKKEGFIVYALATQMVDQFLTATKTTYTLSKYQLIGTAAMLLASKYENIYEYDIRGLIAATKYAYSKQELIAMETEIVTTLTHPYSPTLATFYQLQYTEVADANAEYLMKLIVYASAAEQFIGVLPSKVVKKCIQYVNTTPTENLVPVHTLTYSTPFDTINTAVDAVIVATRRHNKHRSRTASASASTVR